jgi:hypothetical protein
MRASATQTVGTAGQSFVKAQMEELGWGVVANPEHDLGTDLWLMARDPRRFDVGALVGAQVKSGASYFSEPEIVEGQVAGWWYRESDDRHFNYWCEHNIPHIMVLHDPALKKSFWVSITAQSVVKAGRGRKILIPAKSTLDADHLEELLIVATSRREVPQWEGSAWHVGREVPEESRFRYALVTPRLVAPHPNRRVDVISSDQAIALLVQMRLSELRRYEEMEELIAPQLAAGSGEFGWRLYAALSSWLLDDDLGPLHAVAAAALLPHERTATTVCLSQAHLERGSVSGAAALLEWSLAFNDANPVDHAWLTCHKSRCDMESGHSESARREAVAVQLLRHVATQDPTGRALVGSASQIIFSLGDWGPESLADSIEGRDTAAVWWRSQTLVTALDEHFQQSYRSWSSDPSITLTNEDVVWTRLRSAMLLAGFAGDFHGWRHAAALLAQCQLMASGQDDQRRWAIGLLRVAGAEKAMRLAVGRILEQGPVSALIDAGTELDLASTTRTSFQSDVALLVSSADVLHQSICDRHVEWCLGVLADPGAFEERLNPGLMVAPLLVQLVTGLYTVTSEQVQSRVRAHLARLPAVGDTLSAMRYAELIDEVAAASWSLNEVRDLSARPPGDAPELLRAIERLRSQLDPVARSGLLNRIGGGDLFALESFGSVVDLPDGVVADLIVTIAARVRKRISQARAGTFELGGFDLVRTLVLLNLWHPAVADWEPVVEAFDEPESHPHHLVGAIILLRDSPDRVPPAIREALRPSLAMLAARMGGTHRDVLLGPVDISGASWAALAQLFPDAVTDIDLNRRLLGDDGERSAVVQIIIRREEESQIGTLTLLARDASAKVRRAVAHGLAHWLVRGVAVPGSRAVLADLLSGPDVTLAVAASGALDAPWGEGADQLSALLAGSPSATVRRRLANFTKLREASRST